MGGILLGSQSICESLIKYHEDIGAVLHCVARYVTLSPFKCSLSYQPPLFPVQEDEIAILSVQAIFTAGLLC